MILSFLLGFILGIALGSFFPIHLGFFLIWLSLAAIFFIYRYYVEDRNRFAITCLFFVMLGSLFGMGRIFISDLYAASHLDVYVGEKITVEGVIDGEPDVREHNTKLTVKLSKIFEGEKVVDVKEKILVTIPIYPEYSYGDKVRMDVTLSEPKAIESDDGRIFDYKGYLRVRGIWYTSSFTRVKLVSSGNGSFIKDRLFKIKRMFTESIENALPQPESSLLSGLLLGGKQSLGKELLSEFQLTGTSHIVVLSGYNIAIVAECIMALLAFLPQTISFGVGAVSIALFTTLSGGGASAWRAAIMVLVALFAKKTNRDYKVGRALGFAIVLMLASNPTLLVFDPSFQLSILATIGIVFVSPFVSPYLSKVTERFGIREIVSSTIATQITVLPYLIYTTGIVSLVSLPVNVMILSTIPMTMLFGFITGISGLISLYLSFIPALPTYVLLWYQLAIVHIGAKLPFGAISLPTFSPILIFPIYLGIFLVLITKRRPSQKKSASERFRV